MESIKLHYRCLNCNWEKIKKVKFDYTTEYPKFKKHKCAENTEGTMVLFKKIIPGEIE